MKEIYADFNDIASDGTLPLTCHGSIASIANQGAPLKDGEEVWLSDGELRVKGRVFWSKRGFWEGDAVARLDAELADYVHEVRESLLAACSELAAELQRDASVRNEG